MTATITKAPFWTLLCLLATGCTNTLYQADLDVLDSAGKARKSVLYWTKTDKLIGDSKAGPIVLMTACSTRRINFDDSEKGIVFRGEPGRDRLAGQADSVPEGQLCGRIESSARIEELTAGPLLLTIKCEALSDEFTLNAPGFSAAYIQARDEPYQYNIQETSSWSLFGAIPTGPLPPPCQ